MEHKERSGLWNARFFREFFSLSVPIILTNLMASSLHIIDNIMVGSLGEVELASVALANQLAFILRITLFGVACGCAVFCSQYWGIQDVKGVRRTMGITMLSALTISALAGSAAIFAPSMVMRIYTPDPAVIALGSDYLRIVGPSYFIIALSTVYNSANRSTERVQINMIAGMAAIAVNTFLNWCMIFGNLGFPRMGVRGAALATAIAVVVEAAMLIGWSYYKRYPSAAKPRELLPGSRSFVKSYYKIAIPVMLNEILWSIGTSAYSAIWGRMSTQAVAAMNVFSTVEQTIMAAVWGTMNAAAVMVGKRIGSGDEEEAVRCAKRMLVMSVAVALFMGCLLFFTRHQVVTLFNISQQAKNMAVGVMGAAAVTLWARAFNSVNIVGVLRAGGDAVFSMALDGGAIWVIGVPIALLAGLVLNQPLPVVYLLIQGEQIFKMIVGIARFRSRKWINNLVQ